MLGHDSSEELSISPNAKINNPMGILGVLVSHLLIKLGLGYTSIVIPLLSAYWGWVFFSKIEIEEPLKVSFYAPNIIINLAKLPCIVSCNINASTNIKVSCFLSKYPIGSKINNSKV